MDKPLLRFMQALALVVGGSACSSEDASPGTCLGSFSATPYSTGCEASRQCGWDNLQGHAVCTSLTGGASCGAIRCGDSCVCQDPKKSTCQCSGAVAGPRMPPELA